MAAPAATRMRLTIDVLPLTTENSHGPGQYRELALAALKGRKFALPVQLEDTFEQVWAQIEERYKRNYLQPHEASSFTIKKLQDAYECDLDLSDTVASIYEGEADPQKRLIKVVPSFVYRDFSVPVTSNLRPAEAQKRHLEIHGELPSKRRRLEEQELDSHVDESMRDRPLPSTESEQSGLANGTQPGEYSLQGQLEQHSLQSQLEEHSLQRRDWARRSKSGGSVIFIQDSQTGQAVFPPVIKEESPELGMPIVRTQPIAGVREISSQALEETQKRLQSPFTEAPVRHDPEHSRSSGAVLSEDEQAPENERDSLWPFSSPEPFMKPTKQQKVYSARHIAKTNTLQRSQRQPSRSHSPIMTSFNDSNISSKTPNPSAKSRAFKVKNAIEDEIVSTPQSGQRESSWARYSSPDEILPLPLPSVTPQPPSIHERSAESSRPIPEGTPHSINGSLPTSSQAKFSASKTKPMPRKTPIPLPTGKAQPFKTHTFRVLPQGELHADVRMRSKNSQTHELPKDGTKAMLLKTPSKSDESSSLKKPSQRFFVMGSPQTPAGETAAKKRGRPRKGNEGITLTWMSSQTPSSSAPNSSQLANEFVKDKQLSTGALLQGLSSPKKRANKQKLPEAKSSSVNPDVPLPMSPQDVNQADIRATESTIPVPTPKPQKSSRGSEVPLPENVKHRYPKATSTPSVVKEGAEVAQPKSATKPLQAKPTVAAYQRSPLPDVPSSAGRSLDFPMILSSAESSSEEEDEDEEQAGEEVNEVRDKVSVDEDVSDVEQHRLNGVNRNRDNTSVDPNEAVVDQLMSEIDHHHTARSNSPEDVQESNSKVEEDLNNIVDDAPEKPSPVHLTRQSPTWGFETVSEEKDEGAKPDTTAQAVSTSPSPSPSESDVADKKDEESESDDSSTRSSPVATHQPARFLSHSPTPEQSESEEESPDLTPAPGKPGVDAKDKQESSNDEDSSDTSSTSSEDEEDEEESESEEADGAATIPPSSPPQMPAQTNGKILSPPIPVPSKARSTSHIPLPNPTRSTPTVSQRATSQRPAIQQAPSNVSARSSQLLNSARRQPQYPKIKQQLLAERAAARTEQKSKTFDPSSTSMGKLSNAKANTKALNFGDDSDDDESSDSSSSSESEGRAGCAIA